jgi:hypothetical protein
MFRLLCALVVGGNLSVFAFLLLTGNYINDGPVLIRVTADHGIHAGDLFVVADWAVAMMALTLLTRRTGRVRALEPSAAAAAGRPDRG